MKTSITIDYGIRIQRYIKLIEVELPQLEKLNFQAYKRYKKEYENITIEYENKIKNAEPQKIYQALYNCRSSIYGHFPENYSVSYGYNLLESINENKVDDKKFEQKLIQYTQELNIYTEEYLQSNPVKKKVTRNREAFQELSHLVKQRKYFFEALFFALRQISVLPEKIKPHITTLEIYVEKVDDVKSDFNNFVEDYEKKDKIFLSKGNRDKKKEIIGNEKKIMDECHDLFVEFLTNTKSALTMICDYYDQSQKFSKKLEKNDLLTGIKALNDPKKLKYLFEKNLQISIDFSKKAKQVVPSTRNRSSAFLDRKSLGADEIKISHKDFSNIVNVVQQVNQHGRVIIFDFEYMLINRLKYLKDTNKQEELERQVNVIKNHITTLSNENKKKQLRSDKIIFLDKLSKLFEENINPPIVVMSEKILDFLNAKDFLPDNWEPERTDPIFFKFPCSNNLRLPTAHSAHRLGKIIAMAGPGKSSIVEHKHSNIEKFFEVFFLLAKNNSAPLQIFALGSDFENYFKDGKYNSIQATVKDNQLFLIKENEKLIIHYNHIKVPDNHSINLDYDGLIKFLAIYNNCDATHPIVIHCASGVGRTGQIVNIFNLLDELQSNKELRSRVDNVLDNMNIQKLASDIEYTRQTKEENLYKIRKERFFIQTYCQDFDSFPIILLLRATQRHQVDANDFTKRDIEALRNELIKIWSLPDNSCLTKDTVTEFSISISPTAKLISKTSASIATNMVSHWAKNQNIPKTPRGNLLSQTREIDPQEKIENQTQGFN